MIVLFFLFPLAFPYSRRSWKNWGVWGLIMWSNPANAINTEARVQKLIKIADAIFNDGVLKISRISTSCCRGGGNEIWTIIEDVDRGCNLSLYLNDKEKEKNAQNLQKRHEIHFPGITGPHEQILYSLNTTAWGRGATWCTWTHKWQKCKKQNFLGK